MTLRYQAPPYIHDESLTFDSYNGGFPPSKESINNSSRQRMGFLNAFAVTKDNKYTIAVSHYNQRVLLLDNEKIYENRDTTRWKNDPTISVFRFGAGDAREGFWIVPNFTHVKILQYYPNGNPKLFCVNTVKGLYFYNISSDLTDIGLVSIYNHLDLDLTPVSVHVSEDGNTLFTCFENYLVALDITNAETDAAILLDQYQGPSTENVADLAYDSVNSILIMSVKNINGYADKIMCMYFNPGLKTFTQTPRYVLSDKANHDYVSLHVKSSGASNFLYAVNTNSLDTSGNDTMRRDVGLNVIRFASDYRTHTRLSTLQLGDYWNDNYISLDNAKDIGFVNAEQIKHRYITVNSDGIMCVSFWKDLTEAYKKTYSDYINERHAGFVMYDITKASTPENVGIIYSPITPWALCAEERTGNDPTNTWDSYCAPLRDTVLIYDDNTESGEKQYLSLTAGPSIFPAPRVKLINYDIQQNYQDISTVDKIYQTVVTGDGGHLFAAHGAAGIKGYYYDGSTQKYEENPYYTHTFTNNRPIYTLGFSYQVTDGVNQDNVPYQLFVGGKNIYGIVDLSNINSPSVIYEDYNDKDTPNTFRQKLLDSTGYDDLEYTINSINANEMEQDSLMSQPVNVFVETTEVKTFIVKVVAEEFDGNNPNTKGFSIGLKGQAASTRPDITIGGSQDTNEILIFDQSDISNTGHRLVLSTTKDGVWNSTTPGSEYPIGVTKFGTPGTSGAYTKIEINKSITPTLYYYCENHACMGTTCRGAAPAPSPTPTPTLTPTPTPSS